MAKNKLFKSHWMLGPGGIDCSCCRKGTKQEVKTHLGRALRRKVKQQLQAIDSEKDIDAIKSDVL